MSECEDCGTTIYRDDLKVCPRCQEERKQPIEPQPYSRPDGWAGWREYYDDEKTD